MSAQLLKRKTICKDYIYSLKTGVFLVNGNHCARSLEDKAE